MRRSSVLSLSPQLEEPSKSYNYNKKGDLKVKIPACLHIKKLKIKMLSCHSISK